MTGERGRKKERATGRTTGRGWTRVIIEDIGDLSDGERQVALGKQRQGGKQEPLAKNEQ
jgi:hypothetical protein